MSPFLQALIGALLPSLAWLWFFRSRDRHDPEPVRLLVRLFLIGAVPVAFLAALLNGLGGTLLFGDVPADVQLGLVAILVAPVVEEVLKHRGARIGAYRHPAFDEPLDGIVYGTTVGLGFAAMESFGYLLEAFEGSALLGPLDFCEVGTGCLTQVAFLRGLGSAVLHAVASGIAGYAISRRKEGGPLRARIGWVGLAIVIHALWNAVNFLVLVPMVIIYVLLFRSQVRRSPHLAASLRR